MFIYIYYIYILYIYISFFVIIRLSTLGCRSSICLAVEAVEAETVPVPGEHASQLWCGGVPLLAEWQCSTALGGLVADTPDLGLLGF